MSKIIKATLSTRSLRQAIAEIQRYKVWLHERLQVFCNRLVDIGVETVSVVIADVPGEELGTDEGVMVEPVYSSEDGLIGAAVHLRGKEVAFLEFSAGIKYGQSDYQLDSGAPYGMGTYPGKGHWNDPKGWYFYDPRNPMANERGYVHTYGTRPYMPMYRAHEDIILSIASVAMEVFGG